MLKFAWMAVCETQKTTSVSQHQNPHRTCLRLWDHVFGENTSFEEVKTYSYWYYGDFVSLVHWIPTRSLLAERSMHIQIWRPNLRVLDWSMFVALPCGYPVSSEVIGFLILSESGKPGEDKRRGKLHTFKDCTAMTGQTCSVPCSLQSSVIKVIKQTRRRKSLLVVVSVLLVLWAWVRVTEWWRDYGSEEKLPLFRDLYSQEEWPGIEHDHSMTPEKVRHLSKFSLVC